MAFLQSGPARQPAFHVPAIVLWLIGALAAAHAGRMALTPLQSEHVLENYAFNPARYSHAFLATHNADPGTLWERLVPFLSHMALHNDWTHLAINCLWLLAFGPVVARRFGAALFVLFFALCGVAGAGTFLAFHWGEWVAVGGASGAISGLMGASMRMMPNQAPWAPPGEAALAPLFSRQLLTFSAVWIVVNLIAGYSGLGLAGAGTIAWEAHLGGYIAGLLLAGPFDRLRPRGPAQLAA